MSQEIAIIATNARPIGPNMTYVREETMKFLLDSGKICRLLF